MTLEPRLGIYRDGDFVTTENAHKLRRLPDFPRWILEELPDGKGYILRRRDGGGAGVTR